jgi:hypothetical protein
MNMNKLLSILAAFVFAFAATNVLAADPPKDAAMTKKTDMKLEKPASVDAAAWAKMSDAEKQKAVEAAKAKPATAAAPAKKEKKGGC